MGDALCHYVCLRDWGNGCCATKRSKPCSRQAASYPPMPLLWGGLAGLKSAHTHTHVKKLERGLGNVRKLILHTHNIDAYA